MYKNTKEAFTCKEEELSKLTLEEVKATIEQLRDNAPKKSAYC